MAHRPDVLDDPEYAPISRVAGGWRSVLAVPMLREGSPIGTILVTRGAGRALLGRRSSSSRPSPTRPSSPSRTSACSRSWRRATAISPRRWSSRPRPARSCASISSSPSDVQPVFETIVRSAARLCEAKIAAVFRYDGELLRHGGARRGDTRVRGAARHPACPSEPGDADTAGRARGPGGPRPRCAGRSRVLADARARGGEPADRPRRPHAAVRAVDRRDHDVAAGGQTVSASGRSSSEDLRRPGRHRHRERPPVQGAGGPKPRPHRGARAADRDQRGAQGHQPVDVRPPARPEDPGRERGPAVRRTAGVHLPLERGVLRAGGRLQCASSIQRVDTGSSDPGRETARSSAG